MTTTSRPSIGLQVHVPIPTTFRSIHSKATVPFPFKANLFKAEGLGAVASCRITCRRCLARCSNSLASHFRLLQVNARQCDREGGHILPLNEPLGQLTHAWPEGQSAALSQLWIYCQLKSVLV